MKKFLMNLFRKNSTCRVFSTAGVFFADQDYCWLYWGEPEMPEELKNKAE